MWGKFFLLAYTLGPAAALPYAMNSVNLGIIFMILFIAYTAPLPILFFILDRFHYKEKAEKHIVHRVIGHPVKKAKDKKVMNKIYSSFVGRWGYIGHYLGLSMLAFAFGFLWAAIIAYIMKLPRIRSYVAIGLGNIVGLLFWVFITVKTKAFIKPKWVIIIVLLATSLLFLLGKARESKILKKIKKRNKEILSKFKNQITE